MKNFEIKLLLEDREEFDNLIGAEFTMVLTENFDSIEAKLKTIEAIIKPSKKYEILDNKRNELFNKYGDKDENGQLIVTRIEGNKDGTIGITDDAQMALFNEEFKPFLDKSEKVIAEHNKKLDEYSKALNKECGIKFVKVPRSEVPKTIVQSQTKRLKFMIEGFK